VQALVCVSQLTLLAVRSWIQSTKAIAVEQARVLRKASAASMSSAGWYCRLARAPSAAASVIRCWAPNMIAKLTSA